MFERVDKFSRRKKYIDDATAAVAAAKNIIIVTPKKEVADRQEQKLYNGRSISWSWGIKVWKMGFSGVFYRSHSPATILLLSESIHCHSGVKALWYIMRRSE